jgi:preprotein translocase subunit SecE
VSDSASDAVNGDATRTPQGSSGSAKASNRTKKKSNIFTRTGRFVRQVIAELKKVVTPTRKQYGRYVVTVIVFVIAVMAMVLVLDWIFKMGADVIFG